MEYIGAAVGLVSDQSNKGIIQLARLRMLYATNATTDLSNMSLSMAAIGESIFARSANQNQCLHVYKQSR